MDEVFGSLYIDMVEVEELKAGAQDYLYSCGDKFWTIGPLSNFPFSLNFPTSNDHKQLGASAQEHSGFCFVHASFHLIK